jgi:hypothetical protein
MRIILKVNNQRKIEVFQAMEDGHIYVNTIDSEGKQESSDIIKAGDFVTMLNWYRYQKSIGNVNLSFE